MNGNTRAVRDTLIVIGAVCLVGVVILCVVKGERSAPIPFKGFLTLYVIIGAGLLFTTVAIVAGIAAAIAGAGSAFRRRRSRTRGL